MCSERPWTLYEAVEREALHDWLDELPGLRAEARPDPSEYADLGDEAR
jgi:hypothetical protein